MANKIDRQDVTYHPTQKESKCFQVVHKCSIDTISLLRYGIELEQNGNKIKIDAQAIKSINRVINNNWKWIKENDKR